MTTKSTHTPGPWYAWPDGKGVSVGVNQSARDICRLTYSGRPFDPPEEQRVPNAERIVACVNACAGINPEAVPELLAALEGLLEEVDAHLDYHDDEMQEAAETARAAIAKATG